MQSYREQRGEMKRLLKCTMQRNRGKHRVGKTRDLFKKTGGVKGTFHAKTGTVKSRNGKDLTEAEEIKKRWQEDAQELHKRGLDGPDDCPGLLTHLDSDMLECGVKQALGSITTDKEGGRDGTPAVLLQIVKDDAVKVLHSTCQQIWKTQQWPQK